MPVSPLAVATRGVLTLNPLAVATRGYFVSLEGVVQLLATLFGTGFGTTEIQVIKSLPTPTVILGQGFYSLETIQALVATLFGQGVLDTQDPQKIFDIGAVSGSGVGEASLEVSKILEGLGYGVALTASEVTSILLAALFGQGFGSVSDPQKILDIHLQGVSSSELALEVTKILQGYGMGSGVLEGVLTPEKHLQGQIQGLGHAETQISVEKLLQALGIGDSEAEAQAWVEKYLGADGYGEGFIAPVYIVEFEPTPYGVILHITRNKAIALER